MSSRAVCSYVCVQSCLTLCDTMNCSLPGSSFHVIFQARVLKWVAISYSRGSSHPRDLTHVSWIGRQIFYQLQHLGDPLGLWCCCKWHYFIHFYGSIIFPCIYIFIYSSTVGHSGCFQILAIVNSAAVDIAHSFIIQQMTLDRDDLRRNVVSSLIGFLLQIYTTVITKHPKM